MTTIRAHEGETLDGAIWRAAGLGPDALPAVLSANKGLSGQVTLNAGQAIIIPSLTKAPLTRPLAQLWS